MEEKEDAFFCGEVKEKSFAEELKELHLSLVEGQENAIIDCDAHYTFSDSTFSAFSDSILKETKKLEAKVSEVEFVRIWQQSPTLGDVLLFLEEPLRQVITGVPLIVAIHSRARNLRSKGVKLQRFTI